MYAELIALEKRVQHQITVEHVTLVGMAPAMPERSVLQANYIVSRRQLRPSCLHVAFPLVPTELDTREAV